MSSAEWITNDYCNRRVWPLLRNSIIQNIFICRFQLNVQQAVFVYVLPVWSLQIKKASPLWGKNLNMPDNFYDGELVESLAVAQKSTLKVFAEFVDFS